MLCKHNNYNILTNLYSIIISLTISRRNHNYVTIAYANTCIDKHKSRFIGDILTRLSKLISKNSDNTSMAYLAQVVF